MRNKDITPTEERKEQENENNEILLAEDAVQTTAYLANAPDCCSGAEQLGNVLGMQMCIRDRSILGQRFIGYNIG